MGYISVSSPGSFSVAAGASGELHGFTVQLLENSRGRLRARSFTLGKATVAILRVGKLDDMLRFMEESRREGETSVAPSPFSPQQHSNVYRYPLHEQENDIQAESLNALFVAVGSDDGYSAVTLLRIAALVSELCLFLNIDPLRGGPNAPVLKRILLYMNSRLMQHDVSLLCQMIERLVRPAIIAKGFASDGASGLLGDLARQSLLQDAAGCRLPNYIAVLLGHKLVLETSPRWSEEAAKAGGVEHVTLHDSDRYLAYLVTCAFFSTPLLQSCYEVSPQEKRLQALEQLLRRFGIHRHNVNRLAARRAIQTYTQAIKEGDVNESRRAFFFENAYNELLTIMNRQKPTSETNKFFITRTPFMAYNEYHQMDMDFNAVEGRTFELDNICFRNSDFVGFMQLRWIPAADPQQQDSDSSEDENPLMETCPHGYGVFLLYLPPQSAREQEGWRRSPTTADRSVFAQFTRDVFGSMETSFNCFQWLLSPPVDAYAIPGLIHFVVVERRRNGGVVASFHRMMQQRPENVQDAVVALRRLVALNISRAHTFLQAGYSEGLWGHLGMQFFYSVCNFYDSPGKVVTSPLQSPQSPRLVKKKSFFFFGGESTTSTSSRVPTAAASTVSLQQPGISFDESSTSVKGADSPWGSLDGRWKLPAATLPHLALRPMLIPDFTCDEPAGVCVMEVYAVFVGAMSPADVCGEVEKLLRSRVVPL
ncbi:hypothetical protein MOQ_001561 [Trypanosoma cruzi marinkellei]|uniref:Uncharacterized protein n=1 Tax=Trypanosoma cruzi marinkellei TaxID=85056 RepID=K2PAX6_TRYCR|nr:hypothetical protein MOQ_001561 [Trypanosoma cruzi marinkellei]